MNYQTAIDLRISQEPTAHPSANILAVDDIPDNLNLLAGILTEQGYRVRTTLSGKLALKSAQTNPPDLILLDILMPHLDGYEVCRQLKANPLTQDIPVIFISALNEGFDKVRAFEVGGVDYITKPFLVEEMVARVQNQLRLKAQEKRLIEQNMELQLQIREREQALYERQQGEAALRQSEAREREKAAQLEQALKELKRTQTRLIQAEKMTSLSRLIAGVAHEINNPVSFIWGNLAYARNYFQELLTLIERYQHAHPEPTPEIQQLAEEINLNFLRQDWEKLMDSMQVGAQRIRDIVLSLKNFSRLDEQELKTVDIHEGIDNTLLILQSRLRAEGDRPEIQVIREYELTSPVTCYASQLNQVFLHLLNNAIDALEMQPSPRRITIRTASVSWQPAPVVNPSQSPSPLHSAPTSFIKIEIMDNGIGMSDEIQKKMFDPFFTTKPVGSGMGLGLAISHQIVVEKHWGQLSCQSAPEHGTTMTVKIPVLCDSLSQ